MTRTQLYLGGLLLLQLVMIIVVRSTSTDAATTGGVQPLLPDFDASSVVRLEFVKGEDSLELERRGEEWALPSQGGYPADSEKVGDLLDALGSASVGRPVVSSGRYHGSFKVADDAFELRLRAWAEGDALLADLILGSSPNLRTTHLRHAGTDPVFEARGLSSYDYRPTTESWIERNLVDESPQAVSEFSLTNSHGTIDAVREEGGWRTLGDGRPLDPAKVDSLLRLATSLRIERSAGSADPVGQGFDSPAATLRMRLGEPPAGTRELTLTFGASADEEASTRFVTRSEFRFAAVVRESSISQLLEALDFEATDD